MLSNGCITSSDFEVRKVGFSSESVNISLTCCSGL